MATRKALIIGAPDEKIPGVNQDVSNLKAYLRSPVGGLWFDNEIVTLISPKAIAIRAHLEQLAPTDYSLVFFAGHGYHSVERKRTILKINREEEFDSLELRKGAPRHTVILDCCRKPESEWRMKKAILESAAFDSAKGQQLNHTHCRLLFTSSIAACDPGIVVMNACQVGETAGENEAEGGYYTSSLIASGNDWARGRLKTIDLSKNYAIYSTQECHNDAAVLVRELTGGRQNPVFESPRSEKKFPFAIVA